ncbi:hypothetical protein QFZ82_007824 [Streptomyces sp. V4I23]|nr:hypothetical protein [Streptomyces sp. V4I23]
MRHRDTTCRHQLAQVDIARILAPLDSPEPAGFVAALDPVSAVADAADGFAWRLETDDDNATTLRVFDSDWLIVNMSVWRDPKVLSAYVFGEAHRAVLRRRRELRQGGRGDDCPVVAVHGASPNSDGSGASSAHPAPARPHPSSLHAPQPLSRAPYVPAQRSGWAH